MESAKQSQLNDLRPVNLQMIWQLATNSSLSTAEARTAYLTTGQFAKLHSYELNKSLLFEVSKVWWFLMGLNITDTGSTVFLSIHLSLKHWHLYAELLFSLM